MDDKKKNGAELEDEELDQVTGGFGWDRIELMSERRNGADVPPDGAIVQNVYNETGLPQAQKQIPKT